MTRTKVHPMVHEEEISTRLIAKRLRNVVRVSGFYVSSSNTTASESWCMAFYCLMVNLVCIWKAVSFCFLSGVELSNGFDMISAGAYLLYFANASITTLGFSFAVFKFFDEFLTHLTSLPELKWKRTMFMKLCYFGITASVILGLGFGFTAPHNFEFLLKGMKKYNLPYTMLRGDLKHLGLVLHGIIGFTILFNRFAVICLLSLVTYVLRAQFKDFANKIHGDLRNDLNQFENRLKMYWKEHNQLCLTVECADKFISYFISPLFLFIIPIVCALTYNIVHLTDSPDVVMFSAGCLAVPVLEMILVLTISCQLHGQNGSLKRLLHRTDLTSMSEAGLQRMLLFISKVKSENCGYTVFSLFTVDTSAVLMVLGTVATYVLVILQLSSGSCVPPQPANSSITTTLQQL